MRVTLDTMQFRQALAAALPHTGGPKSGVLEHLRVQVSDRWVWVMASCGSTSVMARSSVLEVEELTGDPSTDAFHLSPAAAKAVLAVFTLADELDQTMLMITREITDAGHQLTFQDVGGLIAGSELVLQGGDPDPEFPNVPASVMPAPFVGEELPLHTLVHEKGLARFVRTAKAYGGELTITGNRRTGSSYLVAAGPHCRGLLTIARLDPEDGDTPDFGGLELDWREQTEDLAHALNRIQREHLARKDETEAKEALAAAVRKGFKDDALDGLTVSTGGSSFTLTRDDFARLDEVDS